MEPVHAPFGSLAVGAALQAEEALDLVPAADDEGDGDREQDDERDVEAVAREPRLLLPAVERLAACPVVVVPQLDGRRLDRHVVGVGERLPRGWLRHAPIVWNGCRPRYFRRGRELDRTP